MELQASRSWGEGSEGDGEVHEPVRPVTDGHDSGLGVGDPAGLVLFLADTVDDMLLWVAGARLGDRADQVDLVIFPGQVAFVDVHNVVCVVNAEHGVVPVPVDVVDVLGLHSPDHKGCQDDNGLGREQLSPGRHLFFDVVPLSAEISTKFVYRPR